MELRRFEIRLVRQYPFTDFIFALFGIITDTYTLLAYKLVNVLEIAAALTLTLQFITMVILVYCKIYRLQHKFYLSESHR